MVAEAPDRMSKHRAPGNLLKLLGNRATRARAATGGNDHRRHP